MASRFKLPTHIVIRTIPHEKQDYDTAGNYKTIKGFWYLYISQMKDWRHVSLVLIHELVEMILTKHHSVPWEKIDKWDMEHPESNDPGSLPGCPYRVEHLAAERIEKIMALLLGVKWSDYGKVLEKLKWRAL